MNRIEPLEVDVPKDWNKTTKECGSWLSQAPEQKRRTSMFKNLLQALDENFIGWKIKDKQLNQTNENNNL